MSNIINKSNHPVEVKRINLAIWKLRDEIEKAIANRLEQEGQDINDLDIEDIRTYYSRSKPAYLDPDYDPEDDDELSQDNVTPIGTDGVDSSGNEMDDDAKAMMEALQGADGEENSDEKDSEDDSKDNSEEDDEAAKLAAEMLGDQGSQSNEDDKKDDEEDDEAAKLAAEMLGDQGESTEPTVTKEEKKQTHLKRIYPEKDKISKGFSVLSDINMENIVFFSQHGYTFGQNISIEFLIPNNFLISAEIVSCLDLSRKSKIISQTKPNYRVEATLTYFWEGERTQLRNFLKSVEPDIPPPAKKVKRPDTDDEDDDEFEDLGF